MKRNVVTLMVLAFVVAMLGCNSKEDKVKKMEKMVRAELVKRLEEGIAKEGATFTVESFVLVHKSGNQYRGVMEVTTTKDGETEKETLIVNVTGDENRLMWELGK